VCLSVSLSLCLPVCLCVCVSVSLPRISEVNDMTDALLQQWHANASRDARQALIDDKSFRKAFNRLSSKVKSGLMMSYGFDRGQLCRAARCIMSVF
jgi:hypothetical protein